MLFLYAEGQRQKESNCLKFGHSARQGHKILRWLVFQLVSSVFQNWL